MSTKEDDEIYGPRMFASTFAKVWNDLEKRRTKLSSNNRMFDGEIASVAFAFAKVSFDLEKRRTETFDNKMFDEELASVVKNSNEGKSDCITLRR